MKRLIPIAGLVLAACGGGVAVTEVARYDFGDIVSPPAAAKLPLLALDVTGASWLSGTEMHYRLAYAEPLQRRTYAESRWAAPPTELLESFLRRGVVFGQGQASGSGCRLQVSLEEFEQRFDDPQTSRAVVAARAQLLTARNAEPVARKAFLAQKPAATPNARGGAAAGRNAVEALGGEIDAWLGEVARGPLGERCRNQGARP